MTTPPSGALLSRQLVAARAGAPGSRPPRRLKRNDQRKNNASGKQRQLIGDISVKRTTPPDRPSDSMAVVWQTAKSKRDNFCCGSRAWVCAAE
eukprot:scaffold13_cov377-Prasinococcus_capsulatus_cf.AAC.11